jgi:hypothetical protein
MMKEARTKAGPRRVKLEASTPPSNRSQAPQSLGFNVHGRDRRPGPLQASIFQRASPASVPAEVRGFVRAC